jgi:hypothetical protein
MSLKSRKIVFIAQLLLLTIILPACLLPEIQARETVDQCVCLT